jgi:hypothetical protein
MSFSRLLMLACGITAVVGCGTGGPGPKPAGVEVAGKIYLASGSPVSGGTLVLRPVEGIHGATAQIQSDGGFKLADTSGDPSIVRGKYRVFVRLNDSSPKAMKTAIARRYQDTEDGDSDVVVDIQEAKSDLVIRLNK